MNNNIEYIPKFLGIKEATDLYEILEGSPWRQDFLYFYGRRVALPRLQQWYGEKPYKWSGILMDPLPWSPYLLEVKYKIEEFTQKSFNGCLLNYYRNGEDYVSWHSDDEPEFGEDPFIASLSLGSSRDFILRKKAEPLSKVKYCLEHGSLFLMKEGSQRNWQHSLPKRPKIKKPRINLTFRYSI